MERVLLDTNIYGKILEEEDEDLIREVIERDKLKGNLVIYGNTLIRKELRDTPKKIKVEKRNLRIALLGIFDMLVKRNIDISNKIKETARNYFEVYKEMKGGKSEKGIMNDFIIVASASLNNLDIVFSEDNNTMVSEKALKSYRIVNRIKKIRMPIFSGYKEFIIKIRRLI